MRLRLPPWTHILILALFAILSYGILIPWLGFYWDDFPMAWIAETYGSEGLARYFSTNRPIWGLLYRVTTPLLGATPWHWQVFALFWRVGAAASFWFLLRLVLPKQPQVALWASLFFIVYPGFKQQPIALLYSHFFIVMAFYLWSLIFNFMALRLARQPGRKAAAWLLTGLALVLSLANLLMLEYFLFLELIRPILIWLAFKDEPGNRKDQIKRTLLAWLPYLSLFVGVLIWRTFFFQYQTQNYDLVFFERLRSDPLAAIGKMGADIGVSLYQVLAAAWIEIFNFPRPDVLGRWTFLLYVTLLVGAVILALVYQLLVRPGGSNRDESKDWALPVIGIGIGMCLLAGAPFWLIDLMPTGQFPTDRFSLPFMIGACLVLTGLLGLLPFKAWAKYALAALIIGFAVGQQFQEVSTYVRDWEAQRRFFWQMSWRIPALQPGTLVLSNLLPLRRYSDNSLTAALNWIYAPHNQGQEMEYLLYYPSQRLGTSLKSLAKDVPVELDYLAANFYGNTSQGIVLNYNPPGCLRVLDAELDGENRTLPPELQKAAHLSNPDFILPESSADRAVLPPGLYGSEPAHNWCYFYAKAELARQQGDWELVAELGEQAFASGDYPNDPVERFPFIEGYAHVGKWQRAQELSEETRSITPMMEVLLCKLWVRIDQTTPESPEKQAVIGSIYNDLSCKP